MSRPSDSSRAAAGVDVSILGSSGRPRAGGGAIAGAVVEIGIDEVGETRLAGRISLTLSPTMPRSCSTGMALHCMSSVALKPACTVLSPAAAVCGAARRCRGVAEASSWKDREAAAAAAAATVPARGALIVMLVRRWAGCRSQGMAEAIGLPTGVPPSQAASPSPPQPPSAVHLGPIQGRLLPDDCRLVPGQCVWQTSPTAAPWLSAVDLPPPAGTASPGVLTMQQERSASRKIQTICTKLNKQINIRNQCTPGNYWYTVNGASRLPEKRA